MARASRPRKGVGDPTAPVPAEDAQEAEDGPDYDVPLLGRVAVVGYPNVGKSTLVNRLTASRTAIVHETAGVTRDRKEIECEWNGSRFVLIDTGGVDIGDARPIARQVVEQARLAVAEADLVLFVVDAQAGLSAADQELADLLRGERVEVVVVANKIDNWKNRDLALEFFQLGMGEPIPVSAHHGTNTGDLLDLVVDRLREVGTPFTRSDPAAIVKVAIVGRPNVGKSTMINAIVGTDRVIVSDVAGTTRDAVDTPFEFEGRELLLIDTAGIRRKRTGKDNVGFYSEVRSLQAAERADVAVLLIDASDGLREADLSIADQIRQRDCAVLVALNKWDINEVDLAEVTSDLTQKLRQRPAVITTSGVTGRNLVRLLRAVLELYDRYSSRVPTAALNAALAEIQQAVPPPLDRKSRRRLKMLYGTQYQTAPPRFRINVNDRTLLTRSYGFYVENQLRERFHFEGCPMIIDYHGRR